MRLRNPDVIDIDPSRYVSELAQYHGVDFAHDSRAIFKHLGGQGARGLKIDNTPPQYFDQNGARYVFTQYDYTTVKKEVAGNRMLAAIRPGDRTELAYWTLGATEKTLTIHRGVGTLALGNPMNNTMDLVALHAEVATEVSLPAGTFYSIEADKKARGLLIVSGLYIPPVENWEDLEIELVPGQEQVQAPEGMVLVPDGFRERYEV